MEKLGIDYSVIEKIESVVKRMCCRAHLFLQEKLESGIRREDFDFKAISTPPQCKHLEAFEKEFLDLIPKIKFRSVKDTFRKKLKEEIPKIKQSPKVFVSACKTSNIFEMPEQQHNYLHENITKTY